MNIRDKEVDIHLILAALHRASLPKCGACRKPVGFLGLEFAQMTFHMLLQSVPQAHYDITSGLTLSLSLSLMPCLDVLV